MARAREGQTQTGLGALWAKQLEMWDSYVEVVQGGSNRLMNLWAHQAFGWQKDAQKVFVHWVESAGRMNCNVRFSEEGERRSHSRWESDVRENLRCNEHCPEEHRTWNSAEATRSTPNPRSSEGPAAREEGEAQGRVERCLEVRGSDRLVGQHVYNSQGEKLGKIEDIMLDTGRGEIAYAVLSFGRFLGMGGKHFAVPWSALRQDVSTHRLVLEIRKEDLDRAPGFDKGHRPCTADMEWARKVRAYEEMQTHRA